MDSNTVKAQNAAVSKAVYGQIIQFVEPAVQLRGLQLRWHTLPRLMRAGVADIESVASIGEPFYQALELGDSAALARLIEAGADVPQEQAEAIASESSIREITALKYALLEHVRAVRAIVDKDFPMLSQLYYSDTPPPSPGPPPLPGAALQ